MADHELTRDRRNAVLGKIQQVGLEPRDFEWTKTLTAATQVGLGREALYVPALVHKPTGYAFAFDLDMNRNGSLYSIFRPGPEGPTYKTHSGTWAQVISEVEKWLGYVKAEYEAPDLWAELERQRKFLETTPPAEDNSPFTA